MDKFKIGDVVYHKAGDKLLGTVCEIKGDKLVIRRAETLLEVEMYPAELKSQEEINEEHRRQMDILNRKTQGRDWRI